MPIICVVAFEDDAILPQKKRDTEKYLSNDDAAGGGFEPHHGG